jgi:hypothetical protein
MKKITLVLLAASFSAMSLANTATAPAQEQALAQWVKEKQSIDQIVKNAKDFNKKMNPNEGIGCIHKADDGKYVTTVNPDPKKMEHPAMTPEMQKISDQLQAELKDKPAGEAVRLKNYEFEGKKKEGVAYRIDDRDICMAFWVVANDKVK